MSRKKELEARRKQKELEENILQLRAEGNSIEGIASTLSVDSQQVVDALTNEERAADIGALLQKLYTEIMNRDLADLPTDKLIGLFIKAQDLTKTVEQVTLYSREEAQKKEDNRKPFSFGW